jgi:NADH dehydrogenase
MMSDKTIHAVTGAFGYSGSYIARRLLRAGRTVITLTNSPQRASSLGHQIAAYPFNFDDPPALVDSLRDVSVLYNTYWVRFNHEGFQHATAVSNTKKLFNAAKKAGVQRIVHVSITNPSLDSPLEYFHGKAELEAALLETGISHAILRPAVLFGKEDILINNIAWLLRKFPIFGVFGDGRYRLQPIYVDDLAKLAVEQGQESENRMINAIGPETFTYTELVKMLGRAVGAERPLVSIPPWLGLQAGRLLGALLGDVLITAEEIEGLMADLLYVDAPPAAETSLTDWAQRHAYTLGRQYSNELARRKNRQIAYRSSPA